MLVIEDRYRRVTIMTVVGFEFQKCTRWGKTPERQVGKEWGKLMAKEKYVEQRRGHAEAKKVLEGPGSMTRG
jgi:hypothetical protein